MKFVNLKTSAPKTTAKEVLEKTAKPADNSKFDERRGKPTMLPSFKGRRLFVACRFIGGSTRDNGHLLGTFFIGSLKEKHGGTQHSGVIMTAPHFHIPWIALLAYFVYRMIAEGLFSPIPIILSVFAVFMFKEEYAKQPMIKRYLKRAFMIAEKINSEAKND